MELSLLVFLPVAAAVVILLLPRRMEQHARWIALGGSVAILAISLQMFFTFDLDAPGYQFVGSPNQSADPNLAQKLRPFLERGFAVACSDYRRQGFALPEVIDDTEALRKYFFKTYGTPDTAFIAGHSMGGGVTIGTIEYFPGVYKGALALCPLSSRPYLQTRKEFDLYAVFSVLFPGAVPPLSEVMKSGATFTPSPMQAVVGKAGPLRQRMMPDSAKAKIVAQGFDVNLESLPFTIRSG